jgi:UDP-sugar transporter A1/2/3
MHHKVSSLSGLLLSVASSLLSALGGIYSEKLLKGRASTSIHWQNIQLYVWGVLFNGIGA